MNSTIKLILTLSMALLVLIGLVCVMVGLVNFPLLMVFDFWVIGGSYLIFILIIYLLKGDK